MSNYWEKRAVQRMYDSMELAENAADELAKIYLKSSRYISHKSDEIFEKFKTKHNLSETQARELVSRMQDKTSLDELRRLMSESKLKKAELLPEVEAVAYQARLERLRQLQNELDLVMQNVYLQEKNFTTSFYTDLANETFYKSMFDIQQRAGIGFSFNYISEKQIDKVLSMDWSGVNYSKRIWKNTKGLAETLKEELLVNLLTGRTNKEVADVIANKFASGAAKARRLVRTESNFISSELNFEAYKRAGIEEYQFLATLDLRTSKVCRELDGQIFEVEERQVGINCNPMHPWCRSTTVPVVDREYINQMTRSARDPVTGEVKKVPASMNYKEWYAKYVEGNPEAKIAEKKVRNLSADRKQHEEYRKILGDEIPEKLDDFQDMKYTNNERWNAVKASFRRGSNKGTPFESLQEPLQLKHVRKVLSEMGIDYGDVKIKIVKNEEFIGKKLFGWTNPNGKEVQLYPDAFSSREEMVKTLGHERIHLEQLKLFGPAKTTTDVLYYEQGPQLSEEYWWDEYRRNTGYVKK